MRWTTTFGSTAWEARHVLRNFEADSGLWSEAMAVRKQAEWGAMHAFCRRKCSYCCSGLHFLGLSLGGRTTRLRRPRIRAVQAARCIISHSGLVVYVVVVAGADALPDHAENSQSPVSCRISPTLVMMKRAEGREMK